MRTYFQRILPSHKADYPFGPFFLKTSIGNMFLLRATPVFMGRLRESDKTFSVQGQLFYAAI